MPIKKYPRNGLTLPKKPESGSVQHHGEAPVTKGKLKRPLFPTYQRKANHGTQAPPKPEEPAVPDQQADHPAT